MRINPLALSSIDPDRVERVAFQFLVASAFGASFSLPLGRALLVISILCFLVVMISGQCHPEIPMVGWLAVIFMVIAMIATLNGVNPELGLPKLPKLIWFIGIPFSFMLINSSYRAEVLLKGYAIGAGVLALDVGVLGLFRAHAALENGPINSFVDAMIHVGSITDGQRLMLGILIVVGVLLLSRHRAGTKTWGWWTLLAILVIAQVMNFKRGSWICTIVFSITLLGICRNWRFALVPVFLVVVMALVPAVKLRISQLGKEFQVPGGRMTMWTEVTPALIKEHPWGIGYRSLTNKMMHSVSRDMEPLRDHLHSNFAQILVATGWLGFFAYLLWMLRGVFDGAQYTRRVARKGEDTTVAFVWLVLLLALFANGIVEYNFGDAEIILAYGLIFGTCAAGARGFRY